MTCLLIGQDDVEYLCSSCRSALTQQQLRFQQQQQLRQQQQQQQQQQSTQVDALDQQRSAMAIQQFEQQLRQTRVPQQPPRNAYAIFSADMFKWVAGGGGS